MAAPEVRYPATRTRSDQDTGHGGNWLPSNVGPRSDVTDRAAAQPPPGPPGPGAGSRTDVSRRALFAGVAAIALVAGTGGAVVGGLFTAMLVQRQGLPAAPSGTIAAPPPLAAVSDPALASLDLTSLYTLVAPAVVGVQVAGSRSGAGGGSGFIVDHRAHVITNSHVVQGAPRVTLLLFDGTTVPAQVITTDPANDLAILRAEIPTTSHGTVRLGDSDTVQPGQSAIAMGSPFGLEHSITAGIVSAVDRSFGGSRRRAAIAGLIQTDASINPGNSGGPLFNSAAEVIGVNTLGVGTTGGTVGVNFAVPINAAKQLLIRVGA